MSGQLRAVAVVVAVAAIAFVVYRHEHRAHRNGTGAPIYVLAANRPIQKGTSGDVIRSRADFYKLVSVQTSQIQAGAIVDPSTLTGKVAVQDIPPGQQLTTAEFTDAAVIRWPPGGSMQRAIVIEPTPTMEIGRQITAGSRVDVWVATTKNGSTSLHELDRNMQVLNVDTSDGTVTLGALTPRQAGKLIYASANDRLVVRLHR